MGRVPVREALARLAHDRLITIVPRRGSYVTPISLDDIIDIFEAREVIQCGAAYLAATKATNENLVVLRSLVEAANRSSATADYEHFLRDDHEVHRFLIHLIRNPLLQDAANRPQLHSLRFWRWYWNSRPARPEAMFTHADLLAALENRDPEAASAAMRHHLHASRRLVQLLFWEPAGTGQLRDFRSTL